ncbi:unnamed protein product [Clonostachys byssicola]|uniref:Major facilitator superfamily (MFS) profile domain-containing protein n=1 Tax=Clonostachys byssicola TaxID=160290 RepID=A0A9N9YBJ8_9HYPO|nr:unnamed protein product [Clonostachys byssicola]
MSTTEISAEGRSTDGQPDPPTSHALTKDAPAGDSTILTNGESQQDPKQESPAFQRNFSFWVVIVALCGVMVMASLENTVVVTSGPVIVADLMMVDTYIWISNAFFVTSAAVQPLFGQICDVFGRRWPMLFATSLFILGSGICGGATNGSMMIAGRAIQGSGSGGAVMLAHIILADIVPLRQRGYYLAILLSIFGIGLAVGPIVGGAFVDHATWRWAFYVNLPFGGLTLVLLYLFLHVNYDRGTTVLQKLRRIDWLGNALIMAGTVSMLYALAGAGVLHPWSSWETLVPLLLGLLGLLLFAAWETYGQRLAADLVMPPHLFHHRTSWTVAVGTFFHWMLVYWSLYFVPVYFQAVLLYSAQYTGVAILPLTLVSIVGSILAAMAVSRWGRFKLIHIVGETVFAVGMGLFGLMGRTTTVAEWVLLQCLSALGGGMILDTLLPAFQAPVSESDQAAATSTWTFIRTIGGVWGVAVPATIFNNRIDQLARRISDPAVAQLLMGGGGYEHATAAFVNSFDEPVRGQVLDVYRDAMRLVFLSSVAFGGAAALLFSLEKDVKLREELETDYGLRDKEKN